MSTIHFTSSGYATRYECNSLEDEILMESMPEDEFIKETESNVEYNLTGDCTIWPPSCYAGVEEVIESSSERTMLYGVQLGIANVYEGDFAGFMLGFFNYIEGDVSGVQLASINYTDGDCDGVQIGFGNGSKNINGVQIGAANMVRYFVNGAQISPFFNLVTEKHDSIVNGCQLTFGLNYARGDVNGFQLSAFFMNYADDVNGVQVAPIINSSDGDVNGAQIGICLNEARNVNGTQIAFILNSANVVRGLQLALGMNRDRSSNATSGFRALQIGLVNSDVPHIIVGVPQIVESQIYPEWPDHEYDIYLYP